MRRASRGRRRPRRLNLGRRRPRSPVSSRSIATTTANTVKHPRVNVCTTPSAVISDRVRSRAMVVKPSRIGAAGGPARGIPSRRRVVRERDDDQPAQQRRRGACGEDHGGSARREQRGRGHRSAERGERVQHAAHCVRAVRSSGDFASAGSSAECAGRYSAKATVATTAKPYVAAGGPPVAGHHRGTCQHRGADDSDAGQHPLTANPVGHRREERRQKRRSRHADRRDDADRRDAAVAERHDGERDHERALARPHRGERDLGAAQRPAVHRLERARPGAEPR